MRRLLPLVTERVVRMRKPSFQGALRQDFLEVMLSKLESGQRMDGRNLEAYRELKVELGVVPKAEGSAEVWLGQTNVMAGVKVGTGTPFPDTPDEGVLTVSLDLAPFAHPDYQPGPPDEKAIGWGRVVDRGIREGKALDLSSLVIDPGKKVVTLWLDLTLLNQDGNAQDAAALAALGALLTTRFPDEVSTVLGKSWLELSHYPLSVTLAKLNDYLMVDPTLDEEEFAQTELTISAIEDGRISSMQKVLSGPLTQEDVVRAVSIARHKTEELRNLIFEAVKRHKSRDSDPLGQA